MYLHTGHHSSKQWLLIILSYLVCVCVQCFSHFTQYTCTCSCVTQTHDTNKRFWIGAVSIKLIYRIFGSTVSVIKNLHVLKFLDRIPVICSWDQNSVRRLWNSKILKNKNPEWNGLFGKVWLQPIHCMHTILIQIREK